MKHYKTQVETAWAFQVQLKITISYAITTQVGWSWKQFSNRASFNTIAWEALDQITFTLLSILLEISKIFRYLIFSQW